jgi:hypothetical protein
MLGKKQAKKSSNEFDLADSFHWCHQKVRLWAEIEQTRELKFVNQKTIYLG